MYVRIRVYVCIYFYILTYICIVCVCVYTYIKSLEGLVQSASNSHHPFTDQRTETGNEEAIQGHTGVI